MLMPKRTKFRKMMKGRNRGMAHRGNSLAYGDFGIKAVEHGRVDSRQI
ncbi:MAG: ribosomal protein L16, partial [Aliarcobacter cryaerophilus]